MITSIASDLDGTLLNPNGCLSEFTIKTLQTLHNDGVNIVIATGRLYSDALRVIRPLNFTPAIISCNGAMLNDSGLNNSDLIAAFYINKLVVANVARYASKEKLHATFFSNGLWYVIEENPRHVEYIRMSGLVGIKMELNVILKLDINKILLNAELESVYFHNNYIRSLFGNDSSVCKTSDTDIEIMPKKVNKSTALKHYLQHTGHDLNHCIAFGDALNDFEMLSIVSEGVLMGNAKENIVNLLPDINKARSNKHDGVACYLADRFSLTAVPS